MRYTEEHTYGEQVIIWEIQNKFEGVFIYQCGLSGSPLRASLENMSSDEKSGNISFLANYSPGKSFNKDTKKWEPRNERVYFKGEIKNSAIEGMLTFSRKSCENGSSLKVSLAKISDCADVAIEKQFYDERRSKPR